MSYGDLRCLHSCMFSPVSTLRLTLISTTVWRPYWDNGQYNPIEDASYRTCLIFCIKELNIIQGVIQINNTKPLSVRDDATARSRGVEERSCNDGEKYSRITDFPTATLWKPEKLQINSSWGACVSRVMISAITLSTEWVRMENRAWSVD
jgi:hypothetical protein